MDSQDNRKAELEKKRLKLQELRRAREERKSSLVEQQSQSQAVQGRKAAEDFVRIVLGERAKTPPQSDAGGSDAGSEVGSGGVPSGGVTTIVPISPELEKFPPRYAPELSLSRNVMIDIAPTEMVVYNKEVQTTDGSLDNPQLSEEEIRAQVVKEFEEREKARQAALEEERKANEEEEKLIKEIRELTEEQKEAIVADQVFVDFVDLSSKRVERALNEKYDFMKDYTIGADDDADDASGKRVKFLCDFWDEKWCKNRSVTDINWSKSSKTPELLVASYNKNAMAVNDPDGIACVWNLHLLERPEFIFHSQSDVLTVMFSEFHQNYVIGGTYSGQIVLWDTRAKSLPVLKTPLSAGGHTHPVYAIDMVGTPNAHQLISASTDGFVCSWQLDMLAQPQDYIELVHPAHSKTDEVAVTCVGFPSSETTTFWLGTEEGNMYQANRYDRAGSKAGINQYDVYKGHAGMITGLDFHSLHGPEDFSDLVLTSSVDWTVKLWRVKSMGKPSTQATTIAPLYSFEQADDYIYDVKWSPTHPALFATADGGGKFDLWNLNVDKEIPVVSTQVGQGRALNKLDWDKDGKKVGIGCSDGHVYVYDVGEMAQPRPDDYHQLQRSLTELAANQEAAAAAAAATK